VGELTFPLPPSRYLDDVATARIVACRILAKMRLEALSTSRLQRNQEVRLRRLDIDAHKLSLQQRGFSVIEDAFSRSAVQETANLLDELLKSMKHNRLAHRKFLSEMERGDARGSGECKGRQMEILYPSALSPRLLQTEVFKRSQMLVCQIAGPLHNAFDHAIFKPGHSSTITPWHQDLAFRKLSMRPLNSSWSRLHLWIPLQDTAIDQGCMEFISGSHAGRPLPHRTFARASGDNGFETLGEPSGEQVACPLTMGGLTIHTPTTLHTTGPNRTPRGRAAWIIQFSRFGRVERLLKECLGIAPRPSLVSQVHSYSA
jgi:ectoine hydroxylase-related dioxygenase (phytanoyl-CoA dioxygenase family)